MATLPLVDLKFDYRSGEGFQVAMDGVPIVRGSFLQYYEAGWTKGYYSSNYTEQKVVRLPNGDVAMNFASDDGRARGSQKIERTASGLRVSYEFYWSGEKPVKIENTIGMLWAPAIVAGTLTIGSGRPTAFGPAPKPGGRFEDRAIGGYAGAFAFDAPFARIEVRTDRSDVELLDGRNYDGEWAQGKDLFWLGFPEIDIQPNKPVRFAVDWTLEPKKPAGSAPSDVRTRAVPSKTVLVPPEKPWPVLPKPKEWTTASGHLRLRDLAAPQAADMAREYDRWLTSALASAWLGFKPSATGRVRLEARLDPSFDKPEGYALTVALDRVSLRARDLIGIRRGLGVLAQIARPVGGELAIPCGTIRDWPSVAWRGAHLFVGPGATPFQKRFAERVLAPLGFNKVVLQCEQTRWLSTPGIETGQSMPREELKELFEMYRSVGIEPIPMIQSFGHMEWLFANGKNLNIAFNPSVPYSVDPRKPRTRELLAALWDEAVALLKPKTVHFGLDEVSMRGFPNDPGLVTELWRLHIPWLGELAQKHGVEMMLWGDKGLGPGEAPDAALGDTLEDAKARRDAIPKGALIGDWHYTNNPDPSVYKSLALWKREGFRPIASSWYRENNVYGHTHAAIAEGAGTLQTLWAGYTTTERALLEQFFQFGAFVLAGEYAWSGRRELPAKLPYHPDEALYRWLYAPPTPVKPIAGRTLLWGEPTGTKQVGDVRFDLRTPIGLRYALSVEGAQLPEKAQLEAVASAKELALALDVQARLDSGQDCGRVEVHLEGGKVVDLALKYGRHVRAPSDPSPNSQTARKDGLSAVRIPLGRKAVEIRRIVLTVPNAAVGLRLHGVSAW